MFGYMVTPPEMLIWYTVCVLPCGWMISTGGLTKPTLSRSRRSERKLIQQLHAGPLPDFLDHRSKLLIGLFQVTLEMADKADCQLTLVNDKYMKVMFVVTI